MAFITVVNPNDSGVGSLRDAIARAQTGDTITFAATLTNQTIQLTSGQVEINPGKNITIDGAGAANLSISGSNRSRIFFLNSNQDFPTTVAIKNLNLTNGFTPEQGGAILTSHRAVLTVDNVGFINNVANKGGGAIFSAFEGGLTVTRSRFTGNQAIAGNDERGAGAIAFFGPGALVVRDSEFTNNRGINGGAINSLNGQLTIENSSFTNNDTTAARFATGQPNDFLRGYGGAVYTDRANNSITIRNSVFQSNRGLAEGGAAYLFADPEDTVTVESTVFRQNQTMALPGGNGGNGGAIAQVRNSLNAAGSLSLRNLSLIDNTAAGQGGGLWMNNTRTSISNSTFSGNRVTGTDFSNVGGAMTLYAQTDITNTTIANNFAGWVGGGITASDSAPVSVRNTIFYNNTAQNGVNNWGIQQHTNRPLIDNGGNIQFPSKRTNFDNDTNATNQIQLIDPKLAALQQINGAWVYPLQTGSPAINTGVAGAPTTDQLGRTRDSRPDIGAFEFATGTTSAALPTLRINDVALTEGNSGLQNVVFSVNLSAPSISAVTVNYATANNSAIAGRDYNSVSGSLTFRPGETAQRLSIGVIGDRQSEPTETFFVNLSNARGATLADARGVATIQDNDPAPRILATSSVDGAAGRWLSNDLLPSATGRTSTLPGQSASVLSGVQPYRPLQ